MGLFEKIRKGLTGLTKRIAGLIASFTGANEEFFEELEETLILADMGVDTAVEAVDRLRDVVKINNYRRPEDIKRALSEILVEILDTGDRSLKLDTKPSVILMIGVNGVGKTTTIGKLAYQMKEDGKRVLMCAGDTFRAAAADQLTVWARRCSCDIVKHTEGSDPAAVVFDSISAAKARDCDVILCDTAGRLHNKTNLMNELNKISRVIDRELPDADRETLLVIDATTGQNGLIQAKQFKEYAGITGIILTKLDGTAKGGIVFAICDQLGIPVKYVGVGETVEDLMEFEPEDFVRALIG